MGQFDQTFDPAIFEVANGGDPFLAGDLYQIMSAIWNSWGTGQPITRIPTTSSLLQNLQHFQGRNVGTQNINAWQDFQHVLQTMFTNVDPISFFLLSKDEAYHAGRANMELFEDCGEGLAINIDITDGTTGALATTTVDFTGATPGYPGIDGNWFIVPTSSTTGEVVWFDIAGSGALLPTVTAEVTAYLAGIPWGAVIGGMTFNSITVDPIGQPTDIAIVAKILADIGVVPWLVAGGTATTLTASSTAFPLTNGTLDLYPNATLGTMTGFAPPGTVAVTPLTPGVADTPESTLVTTEVPISNSNNPAPTHNHNCPAGQWMDVFNSNDGTVYRFWMDNGTDPILTPGPGVDVPVSVYEGIPYVDLMDSLADEIVTATGLTVIKAPGQFTIVQALTGDLPDVTNGTGDFRSFTGELRLSDGSVLSTEANLADMIAEHNTTRIAAELALTGTQLPYVYATDIGNWVWKSRHQMNGALNYNTPSNTFIESGDDRDVIADMDL